MYIQAFNGQDKAKNNATLKQIFDWLAKQQIACYQFSVLNLSKRSFHTKHFCINIAIIGCQATHI